MYSRNYTGTISQGYFSIYSVLIWESPLSCRFSTANTMIPLQSKHFYIFI